MDIESPTAATVAGPHRRANGIALFVVRCAVALAFACQLAALDMLIRKPGFYVHQPRMCGGLVASAALLALVLRCAHSVRPWARALTAIALGALTTATLAYYRYYHAPIDAQTVVAARHAWADVKPMLHRGLPVFALGTVVMGTLEFALIVSAARLRPRRRWLAGIVVLGMLVSGGASQGTAEFRTLSASWALLHREKPISYVARSKLPAVTSASARLPNVLFVITESVRASDSCLTRGCNTSPELDRRLPDRITFGKARSVASYTAIALSGILTGQTQLKPRRELMELPDIFDLAHAVHTDSESYTVRYWSSQMAGVLERSTLESIADDVVTAETLLGHPLSDIEDAVAAILDRRVGDVCEHRLRKSEKPQFIVVHLSGTHAPYAFDDNSAPFRPWKRQVTWSGLTELHNAYLNSILEQDRTLGRCIDAYRKASAERPWVFLYTSDHGEAFGEHSAIHHGQNLYDEQISVPFIVASGNGALGSAERQALQRNSVLPITHLDIVPTLLDVWGIRNQWLIQPFADKLPGRSLVAEPAAFTVVPISNCTELFPCPLNTWGMLAGERKLTAQSWDGNWRCLSLTGPEAERPLHECADMEKAACGFFPHLPNGGVPRGCKF